MKLIKHIINLLAIWTAPFIGLLFFVLITGFAFTYNEGLRFEGFIILTTIHCIVWLVMYIAYHDTTEIDTMKIFKTN
jgi:uncharacterized membrane protein YozB (DUF420 family)